MSKNTNSNEGYLLRQAEEVTGGGNGGDGSGSGSGSKECPVCLDDIELPYMTTCGHVVCYNCVGKVVRSKACPVCRFVMDKSDIVQVPVRSREAEKAKEKENVVCDLKKRSELQAAVDIGSSKIRRLCAELKRLEANGDGGDVTKILIFSQFTLMIDLLGNYTHAHTPLHVFSDSRACWL